MRLAFYVLIIGLVEIASKPAWAEPPNVVMIVADDFAWTDYGFMGHPHVKTPHLDRLAKESLTFRRGYVTSSLCCPSLATIITGLYPHQHRVTSNDPPNPDGLTGRAFQQSAAFRDGREAMNQHMRAVPTMPRLLGENRYLGLQTGKWWQGHYSVGGFTHGMTQGGRHGDEGLEIGRKTMQPIFDHVQLAKSEKKPFFIWYAPLLPHDPHTPPDRLLAKYQDKTPSLHIAKYWAMIEWFDESIGQLMDHLDQQGLSKNTLVMYIADNGWIQNPNTVRYAPKSKQSQYDGGLRTPIMLRMPGTIEPRIAEELAQSIDLMPTMLSAIGLPTPTALPGINLLDQAAVQGRKAIYGACYTHNAIDLHVPEKNLRWRWMIQGDYKLIVPDPKNEPEAGVELYQLMNDPTEEVNLAGKLPDTQAALHSLLNRWWNPTR